MDQAFRKAPALRVIAGRPASNAPMPFREPEKPADAVNFCDVACIIGAGMIVMGLLFFVWWVAPVVRSS